MSWEEKIYEIVIFLTMFAYSGTEEILEGRSEIFGTIVAEKKNIAKCEHPL